MCIMVLKLPPGVHNSTESLPLPVECVAVSQSHVLPCVTCDVFLSPGRYDLEIIIIILIIIIITVEPLYFWTPLGLLKVS